VCLLVIAPPAFSIIQREATIDHRPIGIGEVAHEFGSSDERGISHDRYYTRAGIDS